MSCSFHATERSSERDRKFAGNRIELERHRYRYPAENTNAAVKNYSAIELEKGCGQINPNMPSINQQ